MSLSLSLSLCVWRWLAADVLLIALVFLVVTIAFAQQASPQQDSLQQLPVQSSDQAIPVEKEPPTQVMEKPKQQKTETRSAALMQSGDSAAGSIGGIQTPQNVKVTSGGAASLAIPIVVPPGTAGVEPKLAFTYNSQGENSLLGVGWSVSGLPVVHRCPRTVAQDGVLGGINYDANDRFCLDGARLMAINGTYGADGTEYRTEVDTFVKIFSHGSSGSGPAYFTVSTKAGQVMELGNTADSRIEAVGKYEARVWALNKIQDAKGNYFTVSYIEDSTNGEYRPNRIDYTGNGGNLTPNRSVQFFYTTRSDIYPVYVGGSQIKTTQLLTNVQTYLGTTLVRDYRVTYEVGTATLRSRLKTITECDGSGNCLPANSPSSTPTNSFTWQEGGNGSYPQTPTNAGTDWAPATSWAGDFNGDGKGDVLSYYNGNLITFFSNGDGSYNKQYFNAGTDWAPATSWAGDFNGDGKTDLVSYYNGKLITFFSNGDGTYNRQEDTSIGTNWAPATSWAGDFNGDGRWDLLSYYNGKLITFFSNGSGSYQRQEYPVDNNWAPATSWPGDFNGDGAWDLLSYYNGSLITWFSNADGTFQRAQTNAGTDWAANTSWPGDFNGDGKMDLLSYYNGTLIMFLSKGDGNYDKTYYNAGTNWAPATSWVADFNGDGKADLVSYYNSYLTNFFSKGDGNFQQFSTYTGNNWAPARTWVGDYNGDGKADLLSYYNGNLFTLTSAGPYPDLVTNSTNMFGGQNQITYKPLTDTSVYAKDLGSYAATYPNVDLQYPLYVVSNMTVSDGLGTNYTSSYNYGGAKAHQQGRGALGFRWMQAVDSSANSKSTTFYNQTFPLTGQPSNIEVDRNSDGCAFRDAVNTYQTANAYSQSPTVSFVGLSQTDVVETDCAPSPRTIRTTMEYDSFVNGNQSRRFSYGDINVSGDERDERTEWVVDSTNWIHRPKRQALYDGASNLLREKWFYYDNQAYGSLGGVGLLTKEEINAGGGMGNGNNPVATYAYDTYGNRTTVVDARNCTTTTVYETTYQTYPSTVTNCLSHSATMVYDAKFGLVTSQTDANNQTTTSTYDGFGRVTKVTGPLDGGSTYGTVSKFYDDWGTPSLQRVTTYRTTQNGTGNFIWSQEYFDGLGRVDQTQQQGPGSTTLQSESTFDSRGLVLSATALHFSTETAKTTYFTYDVLGRQTRIDHPDSTYATAAYSPGLVILTDERGKVKKKYTDAYNQLTRVDEVNGSETYTTTYGYDSAGSLTSVINHLGHTTRMAYDMAGRKVAMCDPNMGTASGVTSCTTNSVGAWVYTYNPAGDLLTQTDAKSQTLTFTYDSLGRPTTKKQGSTTLVTWTYDDAAVLYSKGRVTQVVDQGTTTKFAYDQLGRVTQTQRLLLGVWHTMSQTYDALNRITSETFPDSDSVSYSYNEAGWLNSVSGYINGITYNARGQRTQLTYANNLTTTWTYDANNFRVTNKTTSNNQQNLSYGYDNNGNITSITDNLFTGSRTFGYDDLNRLTSASGTFGANQSQTSCTYEYDAIGDITNKCGATFTYGDSMHPSAVTYNPATGKNYTYDANGNMITRGTQTLTWDIDNRVSSISIQGGGTTSMYYDYTGMRVEKSAPSGTSLYPFQGYEIDPNGVVTKYIRIGVEIFASKKGTTQYFYHNDHLGSINVVTDSNGSQVQLNEYDPWGSVSKSTSTTEATHRFTGQELDPESSVYYYGGRYYDQEIARFASPDPFVQSPDDPQNLDRYNYTFNNPQNYIDPSGYEGEGVGLGLYAWIKFFMDLFSHDQKHVFVPRFNRTVPFEPWKVYVTNTGGQIPNVDVYSSSVYAAGANPSGGAFGGVIGGSFDYPMLALAASGNEGGAGESDIVVLTRFIFAAGAAQYRITNAMEGLGHVPRNRVLSHGLGYPKTYHDVIYDVKFGKQFNEVSDDPNSLWQQAATPSTLTGENAKAYSRALIVAKGIINGTIPDPTKGAIGFHSLDQYTHPGNPKWEFTTEIGPFKFFKYPE